MDQIFLLKNNKLTCRSTVSMHTMFFLKIKYAYNARHVTCKYLSKIMAKGMII